MANDDLDRRLRLEAALGSRPGLARELLDDPAGTLREFGAEEADLACPDSAHEALDRAAPAAAELTQLGEEASLTEALEKVPGIVSPVLGEDFEAEKVPFGMRFSERGDLIPKKLGLTAKGTVECSFRMKCVADAGVDF